MSVFVLVRRYARGAHWRAVAEAADYTAAERLSRIYEQQPALEVQLVDATALPVPTLERYRKET